MLGEYYQAMGHADEFIVDMLNDFQESGKHVQQGIGCTRRTWWGCRQNNEKHCIKNNRVAQEEAEQSKKFWGEVAETIDSDNEFGGVIIPDTDKQDFFDYISAPVDEDGNTQRDLDYSEANMDIKLAIDYLMYSGFNLEDLIDTKARTQSVRGLRDRIQSNEERVKSARKAQRRQKTFDPDQLDINALF